MAIRRSSLEKFKDTIDTICINIRKLENNKLIFTKAEIMQYSTLSRKTINKIIDELIKFDVITVNRTVSPPSYCLSYFLFEQFLKQANLN